MPHVSSLTELANVYGESFPDASSGGAFRTRRSPTRELETVGICFAADPAEVASQHPMAIFAIGLFTPMGRPTPRFSLSRGVGLPMLSGVYRCRE